MIRITIIINLLCTKFKLNQLLTKKGITKNLLLQRFFDVETQRQSEMTSYSSNGDDLQPFS